MNQAPAVIVKKGGFLAAIASGFFGLLTVSVICATCIVGYGMVLADRHLVRVVTSLPELWDSLPPVISDALRDRRALDYRGQVDVVVRCVESSGRSGERRTVIEVANRGNEIISLLALRVTLCDGDEIPRDEFVTYVATPFAVPDEREFRGPLLPGETRRIARLIAPDRVLAASYEITDLRVSKAAERLPEAKAPAGPVSGG
ncbi:MAG TPA: hypothetical protein PKC49_06715 [Phycisphaerae bacterium]|nr:hypothetical protein [Phycisphaerae bacterium]